MLDFWKLKKYNKLVKSYIQMKFESADLGESKDAIKWVVLLLIPLKDMVYLEETIRLPSPHRINFSVCLSVCLSVRLSVCPFVHSSVRLEYENM